MKKHFIHILLLGAFLLGNMHSLKAASLDVLEQDTLQDVILEQTDVQVPDSVAVEQEDHRHTYSYPFRPEYDKEDVFGDYYSHYIPDWKKKCTIKTNLIGWLFFVINAGVEFDLDNHWSLNIPLYYSGGYNYIKESLKFRVATAQVEARYWIREDNDGWFVSAHAGFGFFNLALMNSPLTGGNRDRDFWGNRFMYNDDHQGKRYQDAGGKYPAYGLGVGFGYRMPISKKSDRWKVEFALGAGLYNVKYDILTNDGDNTVYVMGQNGYDLKNKFHYFCGIDQANISFSYSFDIK